MTAWLFTRLGFTPCLTVLLLAWTDWSLGHPIRSPEGRHRAPVNRDDPLLDAQDFLSQFLSTLNLSEPRPQHRSAAAARKETPEYMLELYRRFASDRTAVPSANIVRSFKNEDSSPYSTTARGVRVQPLLFNISVPHHERVTIAELRLFTLVRKSQRPDAGLDCKVTIYKIHEGVAWSKEVGKDARRRDEEEVVETKDLEELVTQRINARDNSWVSFDLTHVVTLWRKSGCALHRLEVHIAAVEPDKEDAAQQGVSSAEVVIDTGEKHDAAMIVFSDDQSRGRKRDKQELDQMMGHEDDLPENVGRGQQTFWGHGGHGGERATRDEPDEQSLTQLRSNLIYDTPPRIRRNVKSEPCKRTPLFVEFKDIGWDTWIIQPLGYEAYECNGVCSPPMTSEVSPTKHAIVQTLLSVKSPERASRACCVPTKLEPISMLYHENGVITFNHKYEGMVVAECGCR